MEKPKRKKRLEVPKSFKQREYQKVIDQLDLYFRSSSENTISGKGSLLELKLMYLFSSLCLGRELNKEYELEVLYGFYYNDSRAKALYRAFRAKSFILSLKEFKEYIEFNGSNKNDLEFHYKIEPEYKEAQSHLSELSSISHYLYESLRDEFNAKKARFKKELQEYKINKLRSELEKNFNINSFVSLLVCYFNNKKYDQILEELRDYHQNNEPTVETLNLMGCCYGKQGNYKEAFKCYKENIEKCKDLDRLGENVLKNYLECFNDCNYQKNQCYEELIGQYNNILLKKFTLYTNRFKHHDILYKYYPLNEYTLDALINQYFYLASKDQLNDPIELPYECIESLEKYKIIRSDFKISSFSKNQNSMLMWSHYTGNHQGIMVEYWFDELADCVGIGSVEYTSALERFENKEEYIFNQHLLTKNKDWAYEKEVRLFGYEKDKVHYSAEHELGKIQAHIQSITLGYKFPESMKKLIKLIVNDIEKNNNYKDKIKIQEARLSKENPFVIKYK